MIRFILFSALSLGACSPEPALSGLPTGTYAGEGRNLLCVAGGGAAQRAGVIVYGPGDNNCSVSGRIQQASGGMMLIPSGDADCRILIALEGDGVRIGFMPAACAYYCGSGATLDGAVFANPENADPVSDLAGDPLC